jgi:cytidine deaminase
MKTSDPIVAKLKQAALAASKDTYSSYSGFPIGAAVLRKDNQIFSGCNAENASFGLTICAERNAVFQAVSNGLRNIRIVGVVGRTCSPTTPCGACR